MFRSHVGYGAMVLANLHTVARTIYRGSVTMFIKNLSEFLRHFLYRLVIPHKWFNVCQKFLETCFGKATHCLGTAGRAQGVQGIGSKRVVSMTKLRTPTVGEAEMLGRAATPGRMGPAMDNLC